MKILCISGSLLARSANTNLLRALKLLTSSGDSIEISDSVGKLPLFNPDQDGDGVAETVALFRASLQDTSAVVFCTPEYAHRIPGSLKNALDWIVSSGELYGKATAIINASDRAVHVVPALTEVLMTMGARMTAGTSISLDGSQLTAEEIASMHRKKLIELIECLRENLEQIEDDTGELRSFKAEHRHVLFILASARRHGNAERLARNAAESLPHDVQQTWIRLSELSLPPFEDLRHSYTGTTLHRAVTSEPCWIQLWLRQISCLSHRSIGLPASAKLYLDHWRGWLRIPGVDFKQRMAGKTLWLISSYERHRSRNLCPTFWHAATNGKLFAHALGRRGSGFRKSAGDVLNDADALRSSPQLFSKDDHSRKATCSTFM